MLCVRARQGHSRQLPALIAGLLALAAPAFGADCTDLAMRTESAWTAFDDAELGLAADELDAAIQELACQSRLLSADEIFSLFELDALISLGNEDEDRAVYAIIRAVTADPKRVTDPANGPALAELHGTWQRRLSSVTATVRVGGDYVLHLDGRPVAPGTLVNVLEGEHLLQWEAPDGVHSEVRELSGTQTVLTSPVDPSTLPPIPTAPTTPVEEPSTVRPRRKRTGRPAVWGTGLGLAALGGGSVLTGFLLEQRFADAPYDATTYGGCQQGTTCWDENRDRAVRRDATTIRVLYGAGYGLLGVGGVMTVTGFAIRPQADGVQVAASFRF